MPSDAEPHGTLIIDKPLGPTSHDVVALARRVYGTRRVGHTGTLDPMATGVLVLLFGEATKLSAVLTAMDKRYAAKVKFGHSTDSDDALGEIKEIATEVPDLTNSHRLHEALEYERNRIYQIPPNISAIKQNGVRAYRSARNGVEPTLEPRRIAVHGLSVTSIESNCLDLELHCSKGYYVRALARDLGDALGCPAHLAKLRRIRNGPFGIELAAEWPPQGKPPPLIPLLDSVRLVMPTAQLTTVGVRRARNGQLLTKVDFVDSTLPASPGDTFAWVFGEQLIALGECSNNDTFRVTRGFLVEPCTPCDTTDGPEL